MSGLISQAVNVFQKKEYSLLKEGKELLQFQSFHSFDSQTGASVTHYPVEEGSFASVNKVASPGSFNAELSLQGTDLELRQAVEILESEIKDASCIQILTPFYVTPNASVTNLKWEHKEYRGLLIVSIALEEIKEVEPAYTHTDVKPIAKGQGKNAGDTSTKNGGKVEGKTPRKSVLAQIKGAS